MYSHLLCRSYLSYFSYILLIIAFMKQKKIIGLLGGLSPVSTMGYYNLINELYKEKSGGNSSPRLYLVSFDMQEVADLQRAGKWKELEELLGYAAADLSPSVDFFAICTNTMHKLASKVYLYSAGKVLDIRDVVAKELYRLGIRKAGLLGTRFTMEDAFYRSYLQDKGIDVLVPSAEDITLVDDIIYKELCNGIATQDSAAVVSGVIQRLSSAGAEAVILGCTELPFLQLQADIPLLDTVKLHVAAIVDKAING